MKNYKMIKIWFSVFSPDSSSHHSPSEGVSNGKSSNGGHLEVENGKEATEEAVEEDSEEGQGDDGGRIAAIKVADAEMRRGDGNEYDVSFFSFILFEIRRIVVNTNGTSMEKLFFKNFWNWTFSFFNL